MKAVFGVLSLLVTLAVIGVVARHALKPAMAPNASTAAASAPITPRQIEDKVRNDLNKALEQGAARTEKADP